MAVALEQNPVAMNNKTTTEKLKEDAMTNATNTNPRETILNGVNVTKLGATIKAVEQQPELAQFKFRARNQWDNGGQYVATVDTLERISGHLRFPVSATR